RAREEILVRDARTLEAEGHAIAPPSSDGAVEEHRSAVHARGVVRRVGKIDRRKGVCGRQTIPCEGVDVRRPLGHRAEYTYSAVTVRGHPTVPTPPSGSGTDSPANERTMQARTAGSGKSLAPSAAVTTEPSRPMTNLTATRPASDGDVLRPLS